MSDYLLQQLPTLASYLADENWQDIDDPLEHEPNWHQWGVLEHTRRVWMAMRSEAPIFCLAWGVPFIQELKSELVQDKSRWELLLIACVVHDLGKWAGRIADGSGAYSFKGHEAISERLIRDDPLVRQCLFEVQLLPAHLDYVASVVGLHYELGKLRRLAYQQRNFDLAFLESDLFRNECEAIIQHHRAYAREIGLIFLTDSLAKVEFRPGLESLAEIEAKIQAQGLSPNLVRAAQQLLINIAMCREYMLWLSTHR
ncbi:MAG: hypothetical protein AB1801_02755 [Chloroflexota bacterium]